MSPATMRRVATMLMVISVATALAFAFMFLRNRSEAPKAPAQPDALVVATRGDAVPADTLVASSDPRFQMARLRNDQVTEDMLKNLADLDGMVTVQQLEPNRVVRKGHLVKQSLRGTVQSKLPPGYRALTVSSDKITVVGGYLKPLDRIDIIASATIDGEMITRLILQDIEVLAVGSTGPAQPAPGQTGQPGQQQDVSTVTLKVTPTQALKLYTAEQKGRLRFVLRGLGIQSYGATPAPVTESEVFGRPRPRPTAAAPAPPPPAPVVLPPAGGYAGGPAVPTAVTPRAAPAIAPRVDIYPPARQAANNPDRVVTITRGNKSEEVRFRDP
jgi:Flp pilus assembly protein CpaB